MTDLDSTELIRPECFLPVEQAPDELRSLALECFESLDRPDDDGAGMLPLWLAGWNIYVRYDGALLLWPLIPEAIDAAQEDARQHISGHERMRAEALRQATQELAERLVAQCKAMP
jgi:hypothetical protein